MQSNQEPKPGVQRQIGDSDNRVTLFLCLLLILGTWFCYRSLSNNGFISFDDPTYVIRNLHVNSGLAWSGVVWACKASYASNWHPVTWISHMIDCSLFGLNPGGHHLTNLLLHIANTLFLFFLLRTLMGSVWRSFMVAALFAW